MKEGTTVNFDERGLIPVIVQDSTSGEVLMLAYADKEALELTLKKRELYLFSRSRGKLWHKGESSGNLMKVREARLDCDGDALLVMVEPAGPACHTGQRSCFFNILLKGLKGDVTFLGRLGRYLLKRKDANPEESYTARLIAQGRPRIAQKIGEEGVELAIALTQNDREQIIYEASDLLYHLFVGLISSGVSPEEIWRELESRHGKKDI
ncbi:bifunctional phosphoribosyl-AMP cyclohydrolase/phosphoribosyl-ATP diphosphatase HisIE [Acetomicrobium sp.]|uniref:bifunctional phosphoribosyl-AMP cyclohydrolase/phosphoribosyl-ATP diphosphatase HisIE n=1 Tax=Acetomicrobium sp. TaxID=1872099 RepID=UPI001BCD251D|nr:bifunctional phosphoribosyl-AMP cyclohydrolase/phosphoribosyl-ATP diphosphatase HisIE [Acetomicrobium sp.]